MKKHLSNIFNPKSGNTVMFAFDHGYFMGATAGLERLDLLLPKLAPYVDCSMGTRGAIRSCVPPEDHEGHRPPHHLRLLHAPGSISPTRSSLWTSRTPFA